MLPNFLIALFAGAGSGAWIYAKMMRQTGGDVKSSAIVAIAGAAFVAVLLVSVASAILPN